jgi:N-succinyldiaminopimelate aminotransferase
MTALATRTGAINLGQGFPDEDGPAEVLEAALAAIAAGANQYAPGRGVPALLHAVAAHSTTSTGSIRTPSARSSSRRARPKPSPRRSSRSSIPDDEIVVFEPYYDAYAACAALAGARLVRCRCASPTSSPTSRSRGRSPTAPGSSS